MQKLYSDRWVKKLANLNFAIFLLFLIGIVIAIGTIVEQDQSLFFYQKNYSETSPVFNFITWRVILLFQLDHIYTSYGFIFLLFLFGMSLISCTFTVQFPVLRRLKRWSFLTNSKQTNLPKDSISNSTNNTLNLQLYLRSYNVFKQGKKNYAYSGLIGKVGPIVVHASLILLLLGSTIGNFGGYVAQEVIPRGENFHVQNLIKSGQLSNVKHDFSWRINDFWITYTDNLKLNQFYSDLSLLDDFGNEIKRKTIFVNEPFVTQGITLYQTDWDLIGLKTISNKGETKQVPLKRIEKEGQKFWFGTISTKPLSKQSTLFSVLCKDLTGNIFIYDQKGQLVTTTKIGQTVQLNNENTITFLDFLTSTGLQIKVDPGIRTIYFSFLFLMISTYASFVTYSQIWGIEDTKNLFVTGKSNRAVLFFQTQFKQIVRKSRTKSSFSR